MDSIISTFSQLLGSEQVAPVLDGESKLQLSSASAPIACLIYPQTQTELAAAVAIANHQQWSLVPCGQASKLDWGGLVKARSPIILVSTQRLNRLIDHAAGDLTVTVEAGIKIQDLQQILAKSGQFLPINPPHSDFATIGGILATGSSGSWRHRYNSVRDLCLGISFVRADGELVKGGGRVVKNVAGYDMMKLLTSSYGTLGIITQATFRLYPLPTKTQTILFQGSAQAIAQLFTQLHDSDLTPTKLDLLSGSLLSALGMKDQMGLAICFENIPASVAQQGGRAIAYAQALGIRAEMPSEQIWQNLSSHLWQSNLGQANGGQSHQVVAKVGILPAKIMEIVAQLPTAQIQIHGGSGLGTILFVPDISATEILQIRQILESHNGFLSLLVAPLVLKQEIENISNIWGYCGDVLPLMQRLKQKFDPQNLLSPGRC